MRPRRSPRQIVTWTVILTAMAATLTVLWNVVIVQDHFRLQELAEKAAGTQDVGFRWIVFPLGVIFLLAILIGLLMMGVKLLREVDFSQKQTNFIAGITHEFKSPLAAIRLSAETLLNHDGARPGGGQGMSEEDRRRFLMGILEDVDRLNRLVTNVLAAGKIDLHRLEVSPEVRDLNTTVADYHRERSHSLAGRGAEWTLDIRGQSPVLMDSQAMRMVLDNLVENALKYSEGTPRLRLEGSQEGGQAVLRVHDTGIGFDPAEEAQMFERFYRGKNQPRRRVPGSGLGLFLVQHIVRAHGGTVSLSSPGVGRGATAEVRLPLAAEVAAPSEVMA